MEYKETGILKKSRVLQLLMNFQVILTSENLVKHPLRVVGGQGGKKLLPNVDFWKMKRWKHFFNKKFEDIQINMLNIMFFSTKWNPSDGSKDSIESLQSHHVFTTCILVFSQDPGQAIR